MGLVCGPALAGRKHRVAGSEESETCMCGEESYWGMTPVFRNVLLADNTAVSSLSKRGCYQRVDLSVSTITQRKAWGVWKGQRTVASISCCCKCVAVPDTSKHFQLESKLLRCEFTCESSASEFLSVSTNWTTILFQKTAQVTQQCSMFSML